MFYQCTFTTGKRNYLLQFCGYLKKDYRKILGGFDNRKEEPESEEPDLKKKNFSSWHIVPFLLMDFSTLLW